jgi:hypothetical protein
LSAQVSKQLFALGADVVDCSSGGNSMEQVGGFVVVVFLAAICALVDGCILSISVRSLASCSHDLRLTIGSVCRAQMQYMKGKVGPGYQVSVELRA